MSCAAVIINYKTGPLTVGLAEALLDEPIISRVIVVDNSGELESLRAKENTTERVDVIINEANLGYGVAANQGIRSAAEDWVLVVNPDVRFFPGCLESLLEAATKYRAPIVGPRFYMDEEKSFRIPPATGSCLWWDVALDGATRHSIDSDLLSFYWNMRHDRFWSAKKPFFEPFLSGAALLISKKWIEQTGENVFDERFFLYFEDTDLCIRSSQHRDGFPLCVPQSEAIHFYDQAPSPDVSKTSLMGDAKNTFFSKYYQDVQIPRMDGQPLTVVWQDLGAVKKSPYFVTRNKFLIPEEVFFEIGLESRFIPYVQVVLHESSFSIPSKVWKRLQSRIYFGRFRGSISGVSEVYRWKKL